MFVSRLLFWIDFFDFQRVLMVFAIDLDPTIFDGLACLLLLSVGRRDHDLRYVGTLLVLLELWEISLELSWNSVELCLTCS